MRVLLFVLGLLAGLPVQAAEPPLEITLSKTGVAPVTFEPAVGPDGVARVALADLTRGKAPGERLPADLELEVRTSTFGPWMTVNIGLFGAKPRGEKRVSREGMAIAMPVTERRSAHRTVELRAGETVELPIEGYKLRIRRPGVD
jgi:hypothetical protein